MEAKPAEPVVAQPVPVAQPGRQRRAHAGLLGLGEPQPVGMHKVLEHDRRELPHLVGVGVRVSGQA